MNSIVLNLKNGDFEVLSDNELQARLRAIELIEEGLVDRDEVKLKFGVAIQGNLFQ